MKRITGILIVLFLISSCPDAYSFWIWSPKSNKWRNPKYSPLASPKAQLEKAKELYQAENFKEAYDEFRKLVINFPDSKQAPIAQFYKGKCLEALDNPYQAFREYQKVVDSYPYSDKISEIVELEYQIGEYFLNKERTKWLGIPVGELFEHPSIEIFEKVIDNAPYSEPAKAAQYKLGLLYKELGRYEEAIKTFNGLIEKYPESKWIEPARYQLALASSDASLGAEYDQSLTKKARREFQEFIAKHPEAEISEDVQKELKELRYKEAKKYYKVGEFYYKQKDYKSAKIYYEHVLNNYSQSPSADKAREKLDLMSEY